MKYFFVGVIILMQLSICGYTHQRANRLQFLGATLNQGTITENGKQEILRAYSCLSKKAKSFRRDGKVKDEILLSLLGKLLKNFSLHPLKTYGNENHLKFDVFVNGTQPTTITFHIVKEDGVFKVDGIKNLCELFKRVNLSFENE